jgi:hypothetical protein
MLSAPKSANEYTDRLRELQRAFPIGKAWGEPASFMETASIEGTEVHLVGFSVEDEAGNAATGSAGDLEGPPIDRAYFELVERTSIIAMSEHGSDRWKACDDCRRERGQVGADVMLPVSTDPIRWRFARSNGVAVGLSWADACQRAHCELIERDRVLRSWYGEITPTRIELPEDLVPDPLFALYSFEAYAFEEIPASATKVSGLFGFPREEGSPLLYGFGARDSQTEALDAAAAECVQRLGFLWGEEIPREPPSFSPTPDFHQEFYLCPSNHALLRRWLDGGHASAAPARKSPSDLQLQDRLFVDITPKQLVPRLVVAKAIPKGELPLLFGEPPPGRMPGVHPIV